MTQFVKFLLLFLFCLQFAMAAESRQMLIVVSEPGEPAYATEFHRQAKAWQGMADKGNIEVRSIGLDTQSTDGDRPVLEKAIQSLPKTGGDLWLVWIGHGSYDGRNAKFNLRGGDIESKEVATLLEPFQRRLIILNLFSASAVFLDHLAGENRVIISSTRSPGQKNHSRFGGNLADALNSKSADLDLDGEVSLLEATLEASLKTEAFYTDAQRVVQEHSVIEDNNDKVSTPTAAFQGFRAEVQSGDHLPDGALTREIHFLKSNPDLLSQEAREKRTKLELEIHQLYLRKKDLPEDEYYDRLEPLMLSMADLYEGQ